MKEEEARVGAIGCCYIRCAVRVGQLWWFLWARTISIGAGFSKHLKIILRYFENLAADTKDSCQQSFVTMAACRTGSRLHVYWTASQVDCSIRSTLHLLYTLCMPLCCGAVLDWCMSSVLNCYHFTSNDDEI